MVKLFIAGRKVFLNQSRRIPQNYHRFSHQQLNFNLNRRPTRMIIRVTLDFARLPDAHLGMFANHVIDDLTANAAFPTPPVALALMTTTVTDFDTAVLAAMGGGPMATAAKNAIRATLLDMLRKTAFYVQTCAAGDLEKLLSSGFDPISTNRAQTPLPQPTDVNITNGDTSQLVISVATIPNAKSWEARAKIGNADWSASTISTNSRRITLSGLTRGEDYTVEVRAVGGATGFSPWSDPVTHMSM